MEPSNTLMLILDLGACALAVYSGIRAMEIAIKLFHIAFGMTRDKDPRRLLVTLALYLMAMWVVIHLHQCLLDFIAERTRTR